MKGHAPLISGQRRLHQSLSAADAGAGGGELGGVIGVGARAAFGAGLLLRRRGRLARRLALRRRSRSRRRSARRRGRSGCAGSGLMMLTGGVDAADGKSASGRLAGCSDPPGGNAAIAPPGGMAGSAIAGAAGAFQEPE